MPQDWIGLNDPAVLKESYRSVVQISIEPELEIGNRTRHRNVAARAGHDRRLAALALTKVLRQINGNNELGTLNLCDHILHCNISVSFCEPNGSSVGSRMALCCCLVLDSLFIELSKLVAGKNCRGDWMG